jgi:hypothetical protein
MSTEDKTGLKDGLRARLPADAAGRITFHVACQCRDWPRPGMTEAHALPVRHQQADARLDCAIALCT